MGLTRDRIGNFLVTLLLGVLMMKRLRKLNGWQRLWAVIAMLSFLYALGYSLAEGFDEVILSVMLVLWLVSVSLLYGAGAMLAWIIRGFSSSEAESTKGSTGRSFLFNAIKIGALFIALWGVYWIYSYHETRANAALAIPRAWPQIEVSALGNAKFSLSTIWRDEYMSYQFRMVGKPGATETERLLGSSRGRENGTFTLIFVDFDGFKVFDQKIEASKMTLIVDDKRKGVGLEIRDAAYVSADSYRRVAGWEINWSF